MTDEFDKILNDLDREWSKPMEMPKALAEKRDELRIKWATQITNEHFPYDEDPRRGQKSLLGRVPWDESWKQCHALMSEREAKLVGALGELINQAVLMAATIDGYTGKCPTTWGCVKEARQALKQIGASE